TVSTLAEALSDAVWIVGTTSRTVPGIPRLTPREVAARAAELSEGGEVALVFGGESSGLTNDHALSCHALSCIPAGPIQPSYNLAQAVLV
ncbi:MAG TPA: rRNA methyltransferase, partial [Myxococcales bacterium]|nr:rRNA methyltransferase [Myxococcales bacterium]